MRLVLWAVRHPAADVSNASALSFKNGPPLPCSCEGDLSVFLLCQALSFVGDLYRKSLALKIIGALLDHGDKRREVSAYHELLDCAKTDKRSATMPWASPKSLDSRMTRCAQASAPMVMPTKSTGVSRALSQ